MVFTDIYLSEKKYSTDDLIAVLVLYKINLEDSLTFQSLTTSLKILETSLRLIVYDNSPEPCIQQKETYKNWQIEYIHDPSNPGVSKAYNFAADIGKKECKQWILLLDQDTDFPKDTMSEYIDSINLNLGVKIYSPTLYEKGNNEIILSPSGYNLKRGFPNKNFSMLKSGIHSINGKTLLSSGLLIKLETFSELGGYNENLKLDFSDFYFIDRFRKKYKTFYLINLKCSHDLSRINEDIEKSIIRFDMCCKSATYFSTNIYERMLILLNLFLRSLKLSFSFKSVNFILIFLKSIF